MPVFKNVNKKFFKRWTRKMAYALGFFAADGNMIQGRRGNCFIAFDTTDKELIEYIKKILGSDHTISIRARNIDIGYKIGYRLQIGSKDMYTDLVHLGFSPRKSKTLLFPSIPKYFLRDFIRGYFDGDGNVGVAHTTRKNKKAPTRDTWVLQVSFTSGSEDFIRGLRECLQKENIIRGGSVYYHSNSWRLNLSILDSISLCAFMYRKEDAFFLKRKRAVFNNFLKKRKTSK